MVKDTPVPKLPGGPQDNAVEWSVEQVAFWASHHLLSEDITKLTSQNINGQSLLNFSKNQFIELGLDGDVTQTLIEAITRELLPKPSALDPEKQNLGGSGPVKRKEGIPKPPLQSSPSKDFITRRGNLQQEGPPAIPTRLSKQEMEDARKRKG